MTTLIENYEIKLPKRRVIGFALVTACAAFGLAIAALIAWSATAPICRVDSDCALIIDRPCVYQQCIINEQGEHECLERLLPNATCSASDQCGEGRCDLTTCSCYDPCADVICPTSPCSVSVCDKYTAQCFVNSTVPGCCEDSSQCLNVTDRPCVTTECIDNKCQELTIQYPLIPQVDFPCSEDTQCQAPFSKCSPEICGCIDPCADVICESTPCVTRECLPSNGTCVITDVRTNCCEGTCDCPIFPYNSCLLRQCTSNVCTYEPPTDGCSDSDQCQAFGAGWVCNQTTCGCEDPCAGVICTSTDSVNRTCVRPEGICVVSSFTGNCSSNSSQCSSCDGVVCESTICETRQCNPATGTCFVTETVQGCCLDSFQCPVSNSSCSSWFCNEFNQCEETIDSAVPAPYGCSDSDQCQVFGLGWICNQTTCGCEDPCEGVICLSTNSVNRTCSRPEGICIVTSFTGNCSSNSSQCSSCDGVVCESTACEIKQCNPATGTCFVFETVPGCCLDNTQCPVSNSTCSSWTCNGSNKCEETIISEIPPPYGCSDSDQCQVFGAGWVCNQATCGCEDPCEGVICTSSASVNRTCVRPEGICVVSSFTGNCSSNSSQCSSCDGVICESTACEIKQCNPATGTCFVFETVPGCCLDNTQCPVSNSTCSSWTCNGSNQCEETIISEIPPPYGCSNSDQCQVFGAGWVCNQATCGCEDPCEGVVCTSSASVNRTCVRPEGICVVSSFTGNCSSNSSQCSSCDGVVCESTICETKQCNPATGTCFVTETVQGCCLDSFQCPTSNSTCSSWFCNEFNQCELAVNSAIPPPYGCSDSDQCQIFGAGWVCNQATCGCEDPCEGVVCTSTDSVNMTCVRPEGICVVSSFNGNCSSNSSQCSSCDGVVCESTPCEIRQCNPATGTCFVTDTIPGCCLDDSQCIQAGDEMCVKSVCLENNTCAEVIWSNFSAPYACSFSDQCQHFGFGWICNQATCGCEDPCAGVVCPVSECSISSCVRPEGICAISSTIPNCCVNSTQCATSNVCYTATCIDHVCDVFLTPGNQCGEDSDCSYKGPKAYCSNCTCHGGCGTDGTCANSTQCDDGVVCTFDLCNRDCACEHYQLPNCCKTNDDCVNNDPCTTHECQVETGLCIFNLLDADSDNWTCGTDCNDTDASVGGPQFWYKDEDGDGRGNPLIFVRECVAPPGYVANDLDCNDNNPLLYQGSVSCDYQNQAILYNPYSILPPISSSNNLVDSCGLDIAAFGNLTVYICNYKVNKIKQGQLVAWENIGGTWVQTSNAIPGTLTSTADPKPSSVAIYEDLIVFGLSADINALSAGAVYIYRYDFAAHSLILLQALLGNNYVPTTPSPGFGTSVDIYNTTIVVGSPGASTRGSVTIFDLVGPNTWGLTQLLVPNPKPYPLQYGWAVSIFGDLISVGSPQTTATTTLTNFAAVYNYLNLGGVWTSTWNYGVSTEYATGYSVDNNEDTVVFYSSTHSPSVDSVQVFRKDGTFVQKLLQPAQLPPSSLLAFGNDVSVRHGTLVVGAPYANGITATSGAVFIYMNTGNSTAQSWAFCSRKYPFDNPYLANDLFGWSVAVTDEILIASGSPNSSGAAENYYPMSPAQLGSEYLCSCVPVFNCPPLA